MSKRILYINESLNTGSTGHIVEQLGLAALERGYECLVAHGARYVHPTMLPHYCFSSKMTEYTHGLLSLLYNAHGLGSKMATHRLIRHISQWKPDIIHLHNIHGYYINYPILFDFLRSANIPVVWTLHDCWTVTGRCAHFTASGCSQWQTQCVHCPNYSDYPRSLTTRNTATNYETKKRTFVGLSNLTIVPVSNWLGDIIARSFLQDYPCDVIQNGIDTSLFRPLVSAWRSRWKARNKTVILGVASQWTSAKGWNDWMRLAHNLDNRYRIVLVGVSDTQKRQLPDNCFGIKRTDATDELVRIYSAADIYINLAHQEAFGLTLMEAMACGTPCISYRTTAIPEITSPDVCTMVEVGDIDAVIQAIHQAERQFKKQCQETCIQHVTTRFNQQDKINQYLNLYTKLLHE